MEMTRHQPVFQVRPSQTFRGRLGIKQGEKQVRLELSTTYFGTPLQSGRHRDWSSNPGFPLGNRRTICNKENHSTRGVTLAKWQHRQAHFPWPWDKPATLPSSPFRQWVICFGGPRTLGFQTVGFKSPSQNSKGREEDVPLKETWRVPSFCGSDLCPTSGATPDNQEGALLRAAWLQRTPQPET